MVGKYRRDDSDDDDDSSSLEEGQTRNRHPKHRSKTSIDREIHVRDSRKSDEDRRNGGGHRDREREIRDDRYRDSNSRRYDDDRDSRRRRDRERERERDSSEERDRDVRRGKERELEEEIVVKSKIDDRNIRDSSSGRRQEEVVKVSKDLRSRDRRDDRESERRDGDSRRRRNRDSDESEDERLESKVDVVERNRDSSSGRRHDKSKSEDDVVEVVKVKDLDVRDRRDDRESERRDRDSRRRKRDSSESEEEIPKSKVDRGERYKDSTSTRRSEKKVLNSDEDVVKVSKSRNLEDGEIRDGNGKGMDSSHRRRRHDGDSLSSDEDLDRSVKNKGKNQKEERESLDVRGKGSSRTDDKRRKEDGRRKESHGESSEDGEKVIDRKRHREVETSRSKESTRHRGRDEHPRDRERERKSEKKRDDYDDTPRKPRGNEDENKPRRHFLDRVTDRELKKYSSKPGNPEPGTYAALGSEGLNTDTAAIAGKTGGVYIPPFKLAQMMKGVEDKSSKEYQRLTWDALRKSINGLVNKVNAANLKNIVTELFEENLIRGRGLFCRSCMKSQMASPGFTDVFSALVAVVNTKFPQIGELLLRRVTLQLKRSYKRNDKHQLLASVKFIAHLVNQQVAHEIIALELLTVLLEKPSDDSVEVAVGFVTECGALLQDLSPQGLQGIFERFRGILHEGEIDKRVQFLIEGLFAIRRAKFQGHVAVRPELDLVDPEDQLTHELSLEETIDPETSLDIFQEDPDFLENEKRYEDLVKNILGDDKVSDESSSGEEQESGEEDDDSEEEDDEAMKIKDETETNLVNLRRTIYLTIMSSVDFEEAGHKLLKIKLEPGQEMELCIMLLECCSQERTYLRYYGLLGQRFCMINKIHQENFEKCFVQQYSMIHRLETNKLRNVAKFFAHLLGTDALPWHVLSYIRLTEEDTTSSSRIFIKILFQELSEHLGIRLLNERLTDPAMQDSFDSIFPKDNPKNTRFSINFFTSIGLGGITENLREYLKNMPRLIMQQQTQDDDEDSNGGSSPSGSTESDSESSEEETPRKKRKRRH